MVEIPVNAKRIIFTGSDLGDLLALDVKPVGADLSIIGDQIAYPELLDGIEDVVGTSMTPSQEIVYSKSCHVF